MQRLSMLAISRLTIAALFGIVMVASPSVFAQSDDDDEEEVDDEDEEDEDEDEEDEDEEEESDDEDDEEEDDRDSRRRREIDSDEEPQAEEPDLEGFDGVRALDRAPRDGTPLISNKLYPMQYRLEFTGFFDYSLNNKYVNHIGGHGAFTFHIFDYLAVEGFGGFLSGDESNIADKVRVSGRSFLDLNQGNTDLCAISQTSQGEVACEPQLPDLWQTTWFAGASLQWAPIYGKLSIVSEYDLNFQVYLSGGVTVEGRRKKLNNGTFDTSNPIAVTGNYGLGLRLMPFDFLALRVELKNYTGINPDVPERGPTGPICADGFSLDGTEDSCAPDWTHKSLLQVGVSFVLLGMTMKKTTDHFRFFTAFLAAFFVLAATPVLAQDDDDDEEELEDDEDESDDEDDEDDEDEEGTKVASGSDESTPAPTEVKDAGDSQTIYVIQGKPRLVAGSFEIAPQFVQSVNDRFVSHTGFLVSGIYHLKENVAFELNVGTFLWADDDGLRLGGRDTDLTLEIREKERLAPELVSLYRLTWLTTADLQWSPIYGKVSLHDIALGQFNVYFSVGAGVTGLQLEDQLALGTFLKLPGPFGEDIGPMSLTTTFGGGLRFYFGDWFGVRLEVRDYVNALSVLTADVPSEFVSTFDVTNTLLFQAGASFIF